MRVNFMSTSESLKGHQTEATPNSEARKRTFPTSELGVAAVERYLQILFDLKHAGSLEAQRQQIILRNSLILSSQTRITGSPQSGSIREV